MIATLLVGISLLRNHPPIPFANPIGPPPYIAPPIADWTISNDLLVLFEILFKVLIIGRWLIGFNVFNNQDERLVLSFLFIPGLLVLFSFNATNNSWVNNFPFVVLLGLS